MRAIESVVGTLAISAALLVASGAAAKGDSLMYNFHPSLGGTFQPSHWELGGNSQITGSESVPQFNPALGTLNSIDISFGSAYASSVTITGPSGANGHVDLWESTTFQDAGNNINVTIGNEWTCYFSLDNFTMGGSSSPSTQLFNYTSPAVLNEFTGDGNFSLQITGSQYADTFFAPSGVGVNFNDASFGADASVTYNFTAVPEPGSASLLVFGFGLMLARKARRLSEKV